ncbi:uncharacterized protein EAF02_005340 [Botrytis sinoallii]|uniref:uncharacterized protein n=1 Tax=Botrytis sinoallii TaxID=1463999 RepID=UPI0019024F18|nr:uncharacterized protein EAF02_005340 [Botrytis sinoallii]KAF7883420.1 hypothetical protein EAF02_005340 [Botrytis sinoallii]
MSSKYSNKDEKNSRKHSSGLEKVSASKHASGEIHATNESATKSKDSSVKKIHSGEQVMSTKKADSIGTGRSSRPRSSESGPSKSGSSSRNSYPDLNTTKRQAPKDKYSSSSECSPIKEER